MRNTIDAVYAIAEDQAGYLTAAQAEAAGIPNPRLVQWVSQGKLERVSRGVYRLVHFPVSDYAAYMEAVLWPQVRRQDMRGVVSHESALAFYRMSEVSPTSLHITVPKAVRIRRKVPAHITVHHAELEATDVAVHEGVPITTPVRALRDAAAAGLGRALIRQAIIDGNQQGHLNLAQAYHLANDLLGETVITNQQSVVAAFVAA